MRIGELAAATGVSVQAIHYYLREGLLLPPLKTAHNMAYYGPEYVEDIRLIKDLQERRYLPLSVIKLVLDAKRQGKDVSALQDMRLTLEMLFRPLGPEEGSEPVGLVELVAMTGLAADTLGTLEEMGLLMPIETEQGKRYDGLDLRVARAAKKLLEAGLTPSDLGCYRQYIDALQTEVKLICEKVSFGAGGGPVGITGSDLMGILDSIKAALATKVYRQAVFQFDSRAETSGPAGRAG